MKPVIGFIGLGAMGTPMSQRLLAAGYSLVVYDTREEVMAALVQAGAGRASSARDLAERSSVIVTMLPSSLEVEAVVLGKDGVMEGARRGAMLVDMSSSYPTSTRMVCERLNARGIRMLDAPVSGGTKGAREGTLAIMVGGEASDYEECLPIFQVMGKNIYHMGKTGAGHIVKALNNLCAACTMVITSEALAVAAKSGLAPEKVIEVINASTGRSWSSQYKFPTFVLNGAFNSGFTIGLMNKDVEMATRLGRELHTPMFVGTMVQQLYNHAVGHGSSNECHTTIARIIEDWGGVKLRSQEGG